MRLLIYLSFIVLFLQACQETIIDSKTAEAVDLLAEKGAPSEHYFLQRLYPFKQFDIEQHVAALKSAKTLDATKMEGFDADWITQGPGNIGARINAIAVHPTDEEIIYVGFSGGGVWKTEDNGKNWHPIFDDQLFLAIGDITLDPSDPEIVYVGTGDPNISGYPSIGDGVYRSRNGGDTWEHLGLEAGRIVSQIIVHPTNPDVIYTGMMGIPFERNQDRGLYKTVDGGTTWEQVLFVSDSAGVIDLVMHPSEPETLYATSWNRIRTNQESKVTGPDAKVWKTTDGGTSWEVLHGGLPESGNMGRVGIAMSATNPNKLYAMYVDTRSQLEGIYLTEDAGATWQPVETLYEDSGDQDLRESALGGFGWYFGQIRVNPTNDDEIYLLGVDLWKRNLNEPYWERATPNWWTYQVHADKHDLIWTNSGRLLLATDGGLYESVENFWRDIENIPTSQFYRVAYNPHQPDTYYGGMQDNGTSGGNKEILNDWPRILGGDGFQPAFSTEDPGIFYAETQRGGLRVSTDGGNNFIGATQGINGNDRRNWDMQYILSPHDQHLLYTGTDHMYAGFEADGLVFWDSISPDLTKGNIYGSSFHTISTISESALEQNLLYVGTTDGNVWRSQDLQNWTTITQQLPNRYVTSVKASPSLQHTVYVTHSGFKYNDNMAHIHRSDDRGETWVAIANDLPDLPINDVYILPETQDSVLFVATEVGIYGTRDAGTTWHRLGANMPYVPVYDMDWNVERNELIAATFARSIMTYPLDSLGIDIVDVSTDVEAPIVENVQEPITIFPNPAREQITIAFQQNEPNRNAYELAILDANGKLVQHLHRQGRGQIEEIIDISDLPVGNYFVKTKVRHHVLSGQFMKIQ